MENTPSLIFVCFSERVPVNLECFSQSCHITRIRTEPVSVSFILHLSLHFSFSPLSKSAYDDEDGRGCGQLRRRRRQWRRQRRSSEQRSRAMGLSNAATAASLPPPPIAQRTPDDRSVRQRAVHWDQSGFCEKIFIRYSNIVG